MTRMAVTVAGQRGRRHLLVTAPPETPIRELLADLPPGASLLVDGRRVNPAESLAAAGLRDGSLIGAWPAPPTVPTAAPGALALLATSGPAAGLSCAIPAGGLLVGRGGPFLLNDPEMSRQHFSICPSGSGMLIWDAGSANGTVVAGERLQGARELRAGDIIWAGRSAMMVAEAPAADAPLRPGEDGRLRYSRSPRLAKPPSTRPVVLPDPPAQAQKAPFPAVAAVVVPALVGVIMAVIVRNPAFLALTALSPVMLVTNTFSERHRGKRAHRQAMTDYEQRRQQAMAELAAARDVEARYRRHVHPDPATLLLIATAPNHRLWERQPQDEDFLDMRVGTGTVPWTPGFRDRSYGPEVSTADQVRDAPVTLPVPRCGAVGIVGQPPRARAVARAMLMSAAVLHSPGDVAVTVLTSHGVADDWEWLGWLPHARQPAGHDALTRVGNDTASIRARVTRADGGARVAPRGRRRQPGAAPPRGPGRVTPAAA